jgi:hypothetical protein
MNTKPKEKRIRMTTPAGVAVFPHLAKPDIKFATAEKPHGHYRLGVSLPMADPATQKLIADLESIRDAGAAKAQAENPKKKIKLADLPWKPELDENDDETGNVIFNIKCAGGGVRKDGTEYTRTVDVFDGKKNKLDPKKVGIGGGSTVRVAFEPSAFYVPALGAGLTLRLEGVQVLQLVEYGRRDADSLGFESVEDGFDSSTGMTEQESADAGSTGESVEDDAI